MSFYIHHMAGFFFQLLPCAFLCFLPFEAESLRLRRKWVYGGITGLMLVLAALFPAALIILDPTPISYYTQSRYMLLALVLLVAAYIRLLREPLVKKLLVVILVMFYAATQYWLVVQLLSFFNGGNYLGNDVYSGRTLFLMAVITAVMLPPGGDRVPPRGAGLHKGSRNQNHAQGVRPGHGFHAALL